MKKTQQLMAAAAMLLIIISVLITSFQLVIYGDPEYKFYQKEYEKYTVCDALGMKMEDVMQVTEHMMAYLIGEEEELSVITTVEGEKKDFFNEQDRLHMADVKNLFLGGLKVRTACLMLALVLLAILILTSADWKFLIPRAYSAALVIFLAIAAFLGIAFAIDFTKCFYHFP